ncbi:MAG TPA: MFS transporter [Gemmatimonadaceae bacterium]|nr:MFS transporter [Gemmatimonadaceae bacterium]
MGKLLVLMITAFVDMVGFAMVLPLVPFYAASMGATGFIVGLLISSFSVAQLVSAPTWGKVSDHFGRRPAVITGLLISAAAYVVFGLAGTLWLLLLSRVVQGVGGGTVGVLQAYVADASRPEDRAKGLGWLSAATSAGAVVGPAFGSLFVQWWGHRGPGFGAAGFCLFSSIFAWRYLRESAGLRQTAEHNIPVASLGAEGSALSRVVTHPGDPAPRLIWIYTIAIGGFYGTAPLLSLLLADRLGVTEKNVGYFIMYFGAMGVIIRAGILGIAVKKLGEARLARLGLVLLAAGLGMIALARGYLTTFIAITLMPLGTAFLFPCITALLSRVVPSKERGLYMGVQQTYGGVSRVAFPILAGFLMDRLGTGSPYALAAVLVAATLLLTAPLEEYMGSRTAASPRQGLETRT